MTPLVIMAGGRGLRLHPLTDKSPKPLLPVGGKPILEQIIVNAISQGFRQIWLSVNYKAHLIESYFGNGSKWGCKIRYLHESEPLGTGGALKLTTFDQPFVVQNGDVLSDIKYAQLLEHHARSNAEITVALGLHQHQVEYGVARFQDEMFLGIAEKPIENFQVNAGIYAVSPECLEKIKAPFDMPDLMDKCETSAFPIEGFWIDCGNFIDYAKANAAWSSG